MSAGFLITRILLVFLYLTDLSYSSALQTARQDEGQERKVNGYKTRRPLHYIRALRQPNINMQPDNGVKMWQNPSQGPYPSVKPRSFEINMAVPLFDIFGLNERISSGSKDSAYGNDGTEPQQYKQNRARIQSNLKFPGSGNLWNKDATKDPDGRKIGQGVSKPSFQLRFSLPSPDASLKPSNSDEHFASKKPESKFVQNRYTKPAKLKSALTQTGIRLPTLIRKGSLHEQVQQKMGSKRPVLNTVDAGHKQTQQQAFESIYTEPIDGKPWYSGQHTSPQWITQDKTPFGDGWRSQTVVTKPPPLPILNYRQYVYSAHTTSPRKDYDKNQMSQPDPRELHLSQYPQQNDKVPREESDLFRERNVTRSHSGVQIQSRYNTLGSNLLNASKKDTNGGKNYPEIPKLSFQLSLVVPSPPKSTDLTKNNEGHFAQHTGSVNAFMEPTKLQSSSTLTGSNWPLNLDNKHEKMHQTEFKWPALNPDTGHKQTQQPAYEPFQPQLTDGKLTYSTLHSSQYTSPQQISQDKTPTRQSWGFQKPSVTNYPSLPIQEYPRHAGVNRAHTSLPRKPILPRPSQSESLYYSADVKPIGNDYVQGLTRPPTGSPLTFVYERYGSRFKPSIDQTQSGDTGRRYNSVIPYDLPSINPPKWEETTTNYEAGKVQKWQKPTPSPYQYNIRHEASYDDVSNPLTNPFAPSTDYQTQDRFFGEDTDGSKLNGKHKIPKLIIDLEDGDDGIAGRAYFAAKVVHDDGLPGKNKAEMPINSNTPFVNLQTRVSVKKDLLKELFKPSSLNKKPQPNLQIPCVDGADCSHMPEKQRQTYRFPEQDNYSPYIDGNSVFVPTNQQYLTESSSNPIQNILIQRRYDDDDNTQRQQPTSYM